MGQQQSAPTITAEELFDAMDLDNSGSLGCNELKWLANRLIDQHNEDVTDTAKVQELLAKMDENKDGEVSKDEFVNAVAQWDQKDRTLMLQAGKAWFDAVTDFFAALDTDASGTIERTEFKNWVAAEPYFAKGTASNHAQLMLKRMDQSKDAHVSFNEFALYWAPWGPEEIKDKIAKRAIEEFRKSQAKPLDMDDVKIGQDKESTLQLVWKALDVDRSGYLHVGELVALSYFMTEQAPDRETRNRSNGLYLTLDKNKDSTTSIVEFESFFEEWTAKEVEFMFRDGLEWHSAVKNMFEEIDTNKNGRANLEELRKYVARNDYFKTVDPQKKAASLIKRIDATEDSELNWVEFSHFFRSWTQAEVSALQSGKPPHTAHDHKPESTKRAEKAAAEDGCCVLL